MSWVQPSLLHAHAGRDPERRSTTKGPGSLRGPSWCWSRTALGAVLDRRDLAVVAGGEVVARERVEVDEAQVALGEGRIVGEDAVRVPLRLRLLRGLDRDVPVTAEAGTRRDELADDDVLLEADERVGLALHGGL